MRPHLGVQLGTSQVTWAELRDAALRVEELGFDSLWVPDHIIARERADAHRFDAWQVLGSLAALTRRVTLGTLVSPITFRHPVLLAKAVATLDHVSGGRAILGLGAGGMRADHDAFGLPFARDRERAERLAEAVTVARSLLDGGPVTFSGRHYQLRDAILAPPPIQKRLPLLVAGTSALTLRAAASGADFWNVIALPDLFARSLARFRETCAAVGRDARTITATASFRLVIGDRDEITARLEQLRRHAPVWVDDAYRIAGTPDVVLARLQEYLDAGARGLIAQAPAPYDLRGIEALALTIAPRLVVRE